MNISEIAIRRPVFTVMVTVAMLVLGAVGFARLGTDLFPDVSFPAVAVTVPYPGASPAEVENLVTKPLEDAVVSLNGIDRVRTFSREGAATMIVMFNLGVDITEAATEVRERISQARYKFPSETKEPIVNRFDVTASPILTYTLRGETSLSATRKYADDVLRPALEQVEGVAQVSVNGGATREIKVDLDRARLDALGQSPASIVNRLRAENMNVPAGHFDEGKREVSVRTVGEFKDAEQVRNTIVATARDGSAVKLRDVAKVDDGFAEARTRVVINGQEGVTLELRKQSGSNTVEVSQAVKAKMAALTKAFPQGLHSELIIDQAAIIEPQVHQVEHDIVFGGGMAVLVILIFMLDLRSTLISAVALPTSVVGTFFVMYWLGYTLNMMTLARPVLGHRAIDRRCGRRTRKYLQAPRTREVSARGRPGRDQGSGAERARYHPDDRRGVFADRVRERHRRPILPTIRHHHLGRGRDLAVRSLHARSDALLALLQVDRRPR